MNGNAISREEGTPRPTGAAWWPTSGTLPCSGRATSA